MRNCSWPIFLHETPWFEYNCTRKKNNAGAIGSCLSRNIHLCQEVNISLDRWWSLPCRGLDSQLDRGQRHCPRLNIGNSTSSSNCAPGSNYTRQCAVPNPLNYFCTPSHQILAKIASPKAGYCDKADFARKVRNSSINIWEKFGSKRLLPPGNHLYTDGSGVICGIAQCSCATVQLPATPIPSM